MKKTLIALAVLGSVAGVAQAQSNVTIYGTLDAGFTKATGTPTSIGRGDNNKLGFKGAEDLGGGLSAIFQIENRFEPDTGTNEVNSKGIQRPLFQGRSTVGLKGDFGTVRLGRELTAVQGANTAFDPFGTATVGAFAPFFTAGYSSDPLNAGSSKNRFSNGIFYNSTVISGFQANVSAATKEDLPLGTPTATAYSVAGTYNNGPIAALIGYERNDISDKFWQLAGSYKVGAANLMASYAQAKVDATGVKTKSWMLGADVVAGPGSVKVGYGQNNPDGADNTQKKFSAGYWYNLSKRTYLYVDGANVKDPKAGTTSINSFDLGLHHNF